LVTLYEAGARTLGLAQRFGIHRTTVLRILKLQRAYSLRRQLRSEPCQQAEFVDVPENRVVGDERDAKPQRRGAIQRSAS